MVNKGGSCNAGIASRACIGRKHWIAFAAIFRIAILVLLFADLASGRRARSAATATAGRHALPTSAMVPFNPDLTKMVPSCAEWSIDPLEQVLRTSPQRGGHVKLLNFGVQVNRAEGSFLAADRHGGYGLGYGGLALGPSYAVDLWAQNAFENKPSLSPSGRHVLLSSVDSPPKWSVGVFEGNLSLHTVTHGASVHVASLAPYWRERADSWVRLTLVSTPTVQFLYINGGLVHRWAGNGGVSAREALLMFGNSPQDQMAGVWGSWTRDVRLCATADPRRVTTANVQAHGALRTALTAMKPLDAEWAPQLVGKRVLLVGNSKTLLGSGKGRLIDGFDAVFRFNALPSPNTADFGTLVTHEVLGDLTQLCGCPDGRCCTPAHINSIRARRDPSRGRHTIIYAKNGRIAGPIAGLADKSTMVTHISLHRHVAKYVNALMDWEEERFPRLMAHSHRSWADFGFRTGMRVLLILLAHGVEKPTIVGFDLGKQDNPLFNGRRKWSAPADAFKYLPETLILQDMVKGGVILDLMDEGGWS